jgi:hypothetical protein
MKGGGVESQRESLEGGCLRVIYFLSGGVHSIFQCCSNPANKRKTSARAEGLKKRPRHGACRSTSLFNSTSSFCFHAASGFCSKTTHTCCSYLCPTAARGTRSTSGGRECRRPRARGPRLGQRRRSCHPRRRSHCPQRTFLAVLRSSICFFLSFSPCFSLLLMSNLNCALVLVLCSAHLAADRPPRTCAWERGTRGARVFDCLLREHRAEKWQRQKREGVQAIFAHSKMKIRKMTPLARKSFENAA